jgi:hypothetical protein
MIPATLQFIIAMMASAINERMQRKLGYVQEEVRVLKEVVLATTGSARISFTAGQRRRLALAGKELSPQERRKYCQLVTPATLLAWFRSLGARKYDSSAEDASAADRARRGTFARLCPCLTLRRRPRGRLRMTRGRRGRYSFDVRLFHSLLSAGLSRRTTTGITGTRV